MDGASCHRSADIPPRVRRAHSTARRTGNCSRRSVLRCGQTSRWTCWFPRKMIAEPAYLAKLPDLGRAYVRYCHDRKGIRADLTAETLAAVTRHGPRG